MQRSKQIADRSPLDELIGLEVRLVDLVRRHYRAITDAATSESEGSRGFRHFNFKNPAYLLAHLFQLEHPRNPLYRSEEALAMSIGMVDAWVRDWRQSRQHGERVSTSEWPIYGTAEILRFLDDRLDDGRKAAWSEFVEHYCRYAMHRPFGFTAPNHEAWRCAAMYRAGELLGHPEWREAALFFCERLIEFQTSDGFWEEGRHHGPSPGYNGHTLFGLALLYRHSGAPFVREAGERLVDFICATTFPDGSTIGAFDGRLPTILGAPVVPGLEWTPTGRTLNARGLDLWRRSGRLEDPARFSDSLRYAFAHMLFYGAACHYYAELLPTAERISALTEATPLPAAVDADGTRVWQSAEFSGLLHRKNPWVVALSSQNSDVPKDQANEFRLERQSRIEIWHARAGLVMGGGHNLREAAVPLANVVMDTGFAGETAFGLIEPARFPARRGYYLPRWTRSGLEADGRPFLRIVFAHGAVVFRFDVSRAERLRIRADWNVRNVRRLVLQLPLIAWDGAVVQADGEPVPESASAALKIKEFLRIRGGPLHDGVMLRVSARANAMAHPALSVMNFDRTVDGMKDDEPAPPFRVALVSCQWNDPCPEGCADFEIMLARPLTPGRLGRKIRAKD